MVITEKDVGEENKKPGGMKKAFSIWKKLWIIGAIVAVPLFFVSLCADDDADSFESAQVEAEQTKNERSSEKAAKGSLCVSDFKLNKSISSAVKMLKSKGWKPGDGDEGEMGSEYSGSISHMLAYGYVKKDGVFEGYHVPFVQISYDENDRLAHFRIVINTTISKEEVERVWKNEGAEEAKKFVAEARNIAFQEIQKKCLAAYGYTRFAEEDEEGDYGSYVYGFKNKNDDICKVEVRITDSAPMYLDEDYTFGTAFTLDYVSARYREEEKIANELIRQSGRYKNW